MVREIDRKIIHTWNMELDRTSNFNKLRSIKNNNTTKWIVPEN